MNFHERRDRIFAQYEQGRITHTETLLDFAELLVEVREKQAALAICTDLPEWFHSDLLQWLVDLAARDFRYRTFHIGDPRTSEQIEALADHRQEVLREIGPAILERLRSDRSRHERKNT